MSCASLVAQYHLEVLKNTSTLLNAIIKCDSTQYKNILLSHPIPRNIICHSLFDIIDHCSNSGNLSTFIEAAFEHRGRPLLQLNNVYSPLTHLVQTIEHSSEKISPDHMEDIKKSIILLATKGDPLLNEALALAISNSDKEIVTILLAQGANPYKEVLMESGKITAAQLAKQTFKYRNYIAQDRLKKILDTEKSNHEKIKHYLETNHHLKTLYEEAKAICHAINTFKTSSAFQPQHQDHHVHHESLE